MTPSPRSPTHSRHPSNIDISLTTPYSSRRHSKASVYTPVTPIHFSLTRSDSIGIDTINDSGQSGNGLGNLADELADAWDDEELEAENEEPEMDFRAPTEGEGTRDIGVDTAGPPQTTPRPVSLTPSLNGRHHRRKGSEYDGSDYGDDSDLDTADMPPGLLAKIDMVEHLARRCSERNGTDTDDVVKKAMDRLRDLGSQSGVEGGAARLITAHTAISTHILHQARLLHSLSYPLLSPLSISPDPEFIDEILPLLITINESVPRPTTAAFTALTALHSATADVIQTLNYLSDTLHMSRQTTTTATRRLKSARELVAEMKKEEEAREEGERWIRKGNWGDRLRDRECAGVCGDVVGGFEEVCNGWRARLVAQAEAVGAA